MRFLGIDHGDKKIGLALGENEANFALPYKIIKTKVFFQEIKEIIKEEDIEEIVLGLPKNLNNEETQQTQKVYDFLNELRKIINLPIHLEDERMTSRQAKNLMIDKKDEDASAAAIILESYLKRHYE